MKQSRNQFFRARGPNSARISMMLSNDPNNGGKVPQEKPDSHNLFKHKNLQQVLQKFAQGTNNKNNAIDNSSSSMLPTQHQKEQLSQITPQLQDTSQKMQKSVNTALIKSNFIQNLKQQVKFNTEDKNDNLAGTEMVNRISKLEMMENESNEKRQEEQISEFEITNNGVDDQKILIDFIEQNMSAQEINQMVGNFFDKKQRGDDQVKEEENDDIFKLPQICEDLTAKQQQTESDYEEENDLNSPKNTGITEELHQQHIRVIENLTDIYSFTQINAKKLPKDLQFESLQDKQQEIELNSPDYPVQISRLATFVQETQMKLTGLGLNINLNAQWHQKYDKELLAKNEEFTIKHHDVSENQSSLKPQYPPQESDLFVKINDIEYDQQQLSIDKAVEQRELQLDEYLKVSEVQETFGNIEILQMRTIIEQMRNDCQSQTEQLIFNDKMLNFLSQTYSLKKYEENKQKMNKNTRNIDKSKSIQKSIYTPFKLQVQNNQENNMTDMSDVSALLSDELRSEWEQLANETQDYSNFLKDLDPDDKDEVTIRVIVLRDLQLKRADHFLSLKINTESEMRLEGILRYKQHLRELSSASEDILQQLVAKGNTMEHWQDYLESEYKSHIAELDEGKGGLKANQEAFMKHQIQENMEMSGEIRDVFMNGSEVRGIYSYGWGSCARIELDEKTGKLADRAERYASDEDEQFAKMYMKFLENDFKKQNEKAAELAEKQRLIIKKEMIKKEIKDKDYDQIWKNMELNKEVEEDSKTNLNEIQNEEKNKNQE